MATPSLAGNFTFSEGADPVVCVLAIADGLTAEQVADSAGLAPEDWAEFDMDDFPGCSYWNNSFVIVDNLPSPNTVYFDLASAKLLASNLMQTRSLVTQQELLDGFTSEQIAAQAALPSPGRDVRFQTVINDLNVESAATLQKQVDIAAATTIAEVNAIVYP